MKIKFTVFIVIVVTALIVGCATTPEKLRLKTVQAIEMQGTVIKNYKIEGTEDEIFIVKDKSNKVWKIRVIPIRYPDPVSGPIRGYRYESVYSIDKNINVCFAGAAQRTIPCENLKRDDDLKDFID